MSEMIRQARAEDARLTADGKIQTALRAELLALIGRAGEGADVSESEFAAIERRIFEHETGMRRRLVAFLRSYDDIRDEIMRRLRVAGHA